MKHQSLNLQKLNFRSLISHLELAALLLSVALGQAERLQLQRGQMLELQQLSTAMSLGPGPTEAMSMIQAGHMVESIGEACVPIKPETYVSIARRHCFQAAKEVGAATAVG